MTLRVRVVGTSTVALVLVAFLPTTTLAQGQTTATIVGLVKDATGGLLPGVTVEASSPALIEKIRTGVTNDEGQYRIVGLSPGVYTVIFTLPGFRTLRHDGIELSVGFTATVNGELTVGGVEETLTVSGQAPLVDTRTASRQTAFTRERMDELPTTQMFSSLAVLIPGVSVASVTGGPRQDVGGSMGERNPTLAYHGSVGTDMPQMVDGVKTNNAGANNGGANSVWSANAGIVQEVIIDTSAFSAETAESGVRANYIMKQGGNRFSGSFAGAFTNDRLQANNLDAAQQAVGLSPYVVKRIWDVNPAIGGPLRQDKLWFFYSYRYWGTDDGAPGTYFEKDPYDFVFERDVTRPVIKSTWVKAHNVRLTWQVTPNSKVTFYGDNLETCNCIRSAASNVAPEAANSRDTPLNNFFNATWSWTVSSRLLVEIGQAFKRDVWNQYNYAHFTSRIPDAKGARDGISVVDTGRGITYRALGPTTMNLSFLEPGKASLSYVTGSHNVRIGTQWNSMANIVENNKIWSDTGNQYVYSFVSGVPTSVTAYRDAIAHDRVKLALGIYGQDQWTIERLTLNLGLRFDYHSGFIPEQHVPAQVLVAARDYPEYHGLPIWKDVSPRLGVIYDVFGNGRTALKVSAGKFVEALGTAVSIGVNPTRAASSNATTRAWQDINGDFVPQESELGPSSNRNFGTDNVGVRYADGFTTGWGKRAWNWEFSVSGQHELIPGLSVDAGYFRRMRGNYRMTENVAVTPADFDPYCVTAPLDARLPRGGGYQVCGLFNITPAQFGRNDNVITLDKNVGGLTEMFDGIDVNVTARLRSGLMLQGGTSTGRIRDELCDVVSKYPNVTLPVTNAYAVGAVIPATGTYCNVTPPFRTDVKLLGTYRLPWWDLQTSATFQSIPGPEILAAWAAPAAVVQAGLGRAPSGNVRSVTVPLVPPGTMYGARLNQVDLRVAKDFKMTQGASVQGYVDVYNLLNGNTTLAQNNTFGPLWQNPTAFLGARQSKFGVLFKF
jgi:hypothetical protein